MSKLKLRIFKKTIGRKIAKVLSSTASLALVGTGAACGVITAVNNNSMTRRKMSSFGDTSTQENGGDSVATKITHEQVAELQKATINRYAALLNYYNQNIGGKTHKINIEKQVGIMKNDFTTFVPNIDPVTLQKKSASLSSLTEEEQRYQNVMDISNKLHLDVVDTYQAINVQPKNLAPKAYESFISQGYSVDDAKNKTDAFLKTSEDVGNWAKSSFMSNTDYSFKLSEAQNEQAKKEGNYRKSASSDLTATPLGIALQNLQLSLNKTLRVKNANASSIAEFSSLLKSYSSQGKYSADSSSNVIDDEDLGKLFTYDYDLATGADLEWYAVDTDNMSAVKDGGDYANAVYTETKDFSGFDGPSGTLQAGEFFPGYLARVRIISCDTTTDSHNAKLTLQFGVANVNDPNTILWSDISSLNKLGISKKTQDDYKGLMTINVPITDKEIKYVGENDYYDDVNFATIDLTDYWNHHQDDIGFNESGTGNNIVCRPLFKDTNGNRAKLDNVLEYAHIDKDGRYDLKKHPLLIPLQDVINKKILGEKLGDDIPFPPELLSYVTGDKLLHTHQSIALKITDASYNIDGPSWIVASWCFIDKGDYVDHGESTIIEGDRDAFGNMVVKDIPWHIVIKSRTYAIPSIVINYAVDTKVTDILNAANDDVLFMSHINLLVDSYLEIKPENWDHNSDGHGLHDKLNYENDMAIINMAVYAASLVAQCVLVGLNIAAFGLLTGEVAMATISLAADSICIGLQAPQLKNEVQNYNMMTKMYKVVHAHEAAAANIDKFMQFVGDVKDFHSNIGRVNDSKSAIPLRVEAAEEIDREKAKMFDGTDPDYNDFRSFFQEIIDKKLIDFSEKQITMLKSCMEDFKNDKGEIDAGKLAIYAGCLGGFAVFAGVGFFKMVRPLFMFKTFAEKVIFTKANKIFGKNMKAWNEGRDVAEQISSKISDKFASNKFNAAKDISPEAKAGFEEGAQEAGNAEQVSTMEVEYAEALSEARAVTNASIAAGVAVVNIVCMVLSGISFLLMFIQAICDNFGPGTWEG